MVIMVVCGSGEISELDNYINKAIQHMKDLQTRGFTYSMDARWGATSRDYLFWSVFYYLGLGERTIGMRD